MSGKLKLTGSLVNKPTNSKRRKVSEFKISGLESASKFNSDEQHDRISNGPSGREDEVHVHAEGQEDTSFDGNLHGHVIKQGDEGPDSQDCEQQDSKNSKGSSKKKKEKTPGVIYLSSIPEGMQYNDVYRVFSELGDVGRLSLQVGGPQPHHAKKKRYSEGWVEFLDKKKAKRCVLLLNNQLVGGKKKSKWFDCIWHIRYLPKFQWSHLTERLAYEQASTQQRMRTEINQARQEAQHFAEQIEWKQKHTKMASKHSDWKLNKRTYEYTQKLTDDDIRKRKAGSERVKVLEKSRANVFGSLFGGQATPSK